MKINSVLGRYFGTHKGVRQGDPMSPLLFNIVGDVVARMFRKDQNNNLICGLVSHLIPKGVCILQYADDNVVMFQDNVEMGINVKLLLYIFENMAGLKINFDKSEVMMTNEDGVKLEVYAELFNCQIGSWPMRYPGAPVSGSRLRIKDLKFIEERHLKHLDGWQGGSMSLAGSKILIDSSLNSISIYYMSLFLFQKTFVETLAKIQKRFFWQGGSSVRKYYMIKWKHICKTKQKRGSWNKRYGKQEYQPAL